MRMAEKKEAATIHTLLELEMRKPPNEKCASTSWRRLSSEVMTFCYALHYFVDLESGRVSNPCAKSA